MLSILFPDESSRYFFIEPCLNQFATDVWMVGKHNVLYVERYDFAWKFGELNVEVDSKVTKLKNTSFSSWLPSNQVKLKLSNGGTCSHEARYRRRS